MNGSIIMKKLHDDNNNYYEYYFHHTHHHYDYYIILFAMNVLSLSLSAGIGRTGAFCALSTAIERVKAEGIVNVFHTVKHLRTQRPHMDQTVISILYHPWPLIIIVLTVLQDPATMLSRSILSHLATILILIIKN